MDEADQVRGWKSGRTVSASRLRSCSTDNALHSTSVHSQDQFAGGENSRVWVVTRFGALRITRPTLAGGLRPHGVDYGAGTLGCPGKAGFGEGD